MALSIEKHFLGAVKSMYTLAITVQDQPCFIRATWVSFGYTYLWVNIVHSAQMFDKIFPVLKEK